MKAKELDMVNKTVHHTTTRLALSVLTPSAQPQARATSITYKVTL